MIPIILSWVYNRSRSISVFLMVLWECHQKVRPFLEVSSYVSDVLPKTDGMLTNQVFFVLGHPTGKLAVCILIRHYPPHELWILLSIFWIKHISGRCSTKNHVYPPLPSYCCTFGQLLGEVLKYKLLFCLSNLVQKSCSPIPPKFDPIVTSLLLYHLVITILPLLIHSTKVPLHFVFISLSFGSFGQLKLFTLNCIYCVYWFSPKILKEVIGTKIVVKK